MFGAWGDAVAGGSPLVQLRALDWDMDGQGLPKLEEQKNMTPYHATLSAGPFRDYSQVTVYHPNEGNGHGFVNVGYTSFIGGLTGMSATKLGISEIGASFPDASFGEMSRLGVPFIFLLRQVIPAPATLCERART